MLIHVSFDLWRVKDNENPQFITVKTESRRQRWILLKQSADINTDTHFLWLSYSSFPACWPCCTDFLGNWQSFKKILYHFFSGADGAEKTVFCTNGLTRAERWSKQNRLLRLLLFSGADGPKKTAFCASAVNLLIDIPCRPLAKQHRWHTLPFRKQSPLWPTVASPTSRRPGIVLEWLAINLERLVHHDLLTTEKHKSRNHE